MHSTVSLCTVAIYIYFSFGHQGPKRYYIFLKIHARYMKVNFNVTPNVVFRLKIIYFSGTTGQKYVNLEAKAKNYLSFRHYSHF